MRTRTRNRLPRLTRFSQALAMSALLASMLPAGFADEGMHPISTIGTLKLRQKGLEIEPSDIFSTDKTCLVDGVCRVNGCTGSFISPKGLIFTNHHCAYRAIQAASKPENDILKNGFSAKTLADEIPGTRLHRSCDRILKRCLKGSFVGG